MKSYQVIDFGRPLKDVDLPDPSPTGHEVVVAVKAGGRLPLRPAHLGRRLRSRGRQATRC